MPNNRLTCPLIVLAVASLFGSGTTQAHPGGLDKEGCHVASQTGTRHCHKVLPVDTSQPPRPGEDGVLYGPLVEVKDGDTLIVKIQGYAMTLRLAEIDAPEMDQPFGEAARKKLSTLIGRQTCVVVPVDADRYGRTIARLWIGNVYVNKELVRLGMAWFNSEYATDASIYDTENEARDDRRGLWSLPLEQRVSPWDWRHGKRRVERHTRK